MADSLSYTALFVLQAVAQGHRFGFDIMDVTELPAARPAGSSRAPCSQRSRRRSRA